MNKSSTFKSIVQCSAASTTTVSSTKTQNTAENTQQQENNQIEAINAKPIPALLHKKSYSQPASLDIQ